MNNEQVALVLARVQLQDNRTIDRLVIADWEDTIGDLPFDESIQAVRAHRRESTAYLTTAHVVAGVRVIQARQERALRIAGSRQRGAIEAPQITLDRAQFEADTQAAIRAARIAKGRDPETGRPL